MTNILINCDILKVDYFKKKNIKIFCGPLAQLVEQFPFKEWVDGSSPSGLTIKLVLRYANWRILNSYLINPFINTTNSIVRRWVST